MIHGLFDISVSFINYSNEQLVLQVLLPCEHEKHMLVVGSVAFFHRCTVSRINGILVLFFFLPLFSQLLKSVDANLNFRGQQWYEPEWWKFGDSKT